VVRLEQADVEHVVHTHALWRAKTIGHGADALDNLEWPDVAQPQLPLRMTSQEAQPDPSMTVNSMSRW
jgi:hypothetical protein